MEILSSLSAGAILGLSAGFAPGPLLMLVITQTLRHDIREGVKVALVPLITDLPIILVSLFVLSRITSFERALGAISLLGGFYVLYLSYESARTGSVQLEVVEGQPQSFRKGSLTNALNPHPYLFWLTVGGPIILQREGERPFAALAFVSCFYLLLVGSKVALAWMVGRSRTFLTSKRYLYTMRLLGGILALLALVLFRDALVFLGVLHP